MSRLWRYGVVVGCRVTRSDIVCDINELPFIAASAVNVETRTTIRLQSNSQRVGWIFANRVN
jgi:hypothetical protein